MRFCLGSMLALLCAVVPCQRAEAWNANGHMTIGRLAWDQMDAHQREAAYKLLLEHPHPKEFFQSHPCPKEVSEAEWYFIIAGIWPDWLRGYTRSKRPEDMAIAAHHKGPRHYINLPLVRTADMALFKDKKLDPPDENIVTALDEYRADLLDPKATPAHKAVALCWILHLAGDIHQPLHCVAFFSAEYPTGDLGGNLRWVKDSKGPINLHAYWDNLLGNDSSYADIKNNCDLLTRREYQRDKYAPELAHTKFMEWAREGKDLAWKHVYLGGDLPGLMIPTDQQSKEKKQAAPALPEGYHEASQQVARRQAALAGHRLADLMAAVFPRK
jgi:S1/P1 Nuclease